MSGTFLVSDGCPVVFAVGAHPRPAACSLTCARRRRVCPGPAPLRGEGPRGRASDRIPTMLPPSLPGAELSTNHGRGRAIGVLLTPVFAGALVLTFTVVQARTTTVHAPGPVARRDGLYAVRLSDTFDDSPSTFTARLTGPQAAALAAASGVASVSPLPASASLAPTPSDCSPATRPAAPALVPSPSPLPAPSPPPEDGAEPVQPVPDRGQAARTPSRAATSGRGDATTGREKEAAGKTAASSSGVSRLRGRPVGDRPKARADAGRDRFPQFSRTKTGLWPARSEVSTSGISSQP